MQGLHRPLSPRFALSAALSVPGRVVPMQSAVRAFRAPAARRALVGATGVTVRFAPAAQGCAVESSCIGGSGHGAGRRAGLSPSATSIRVLTATAVSMIAGKIHAVAELYPMARIRSRSARKLTANAPTPMAATALTDQR